MNKTHDWNMALGLRRIGIFMLCMLFAVATAFAQTTESWDDEEDDEEDTEEQALIDNTPAVKKDDVTIKLNDQPYVWSDELTLHREDTVTISVRDLASASRVEIVADKGGINLARKLYYSNKEGELDLEIRLGNKRMKGNITLTYTPSNGVKRSKTVHLVID